MIETTIDFIKSPLNYTGGKYKLLWDIIQEFIPNIRFFVDLFAGGFNVGINCNANKIFCNDQLTHIIEMFKYFQDMDIGCLISEINMRINKYALTNENDEGYKLFRVQYNENPNPLDLFILTCFYFNHQIRFNSKHEFNTPFGKNKSSYNSKIERNLYNFSYALKSKNIEFSTDDFLKFDFKGFCECDLVYCDPPYLISTGSYNDGKRGFKDWTEKEEKELLALLDGLNTNGINFALSNVLHHKGTSNDLLIEWSKKYNVTYLNKSYSNCSYHFSERNAKTEEVLITNYKKVVSKCKSTPPEFFLGNAINSPIKYSPKTSH
jgi:DNA adenine methylase